MSHIRHTFIKFEIPVYCAIFTKFRVLEKLSDNSMIPTSVLSVLYQAIFHFIWFIIKNICLS